MSPTDDARLDNPVHAALSGVQARFVQVCGHALRYPTDVAPFLALPSEPSPEDWRDAGALAPPGTYAAIVHTGVDVPATRKTRGKFEVVQMIGEDVNGTDEPEALPLNGADVPEMLELISQTDPGPFLDRTIELGDDLGSAATGSSLRCAASACTSTAGRRSAPCAPRRHTSVTEWPHDSWAHLLAVSNTAPNAQCYTSSPPTPAQSASTESLGSASAAISRPPC
jgi:hypothetical protein